MRGALATAVMLFHYGLNTIIASLTAGRVHDGRWGLCVDFFFMLSGFVLCQSFLRRPTGLGAYAVKRLFRLAPMFLITTLVVLLATSAPDWTGPVIAANFLMVQSLIGLPSINMVSWSIPFELFFPAVGLLLVGAAAKWHRPLLWGLLAAAFAIQAWATYSLAIGPDHMAVRAASGLAGGALLHLLRRETRAPGGLGATAISSAAFGLAVLVMALSGVLPALAVGFPLLAAAAIWFGAGARGLFTTAPAQALGRWSYSIYLIHIPVLVVANRLIGEGAVEGNPAVKVGLIALVIALAGAAYRFIEAPLIDVGKRVEQTRQRGLKPVSPAG